jgi:hypothetical protein
MKAGRTLGDLAAEVYRQSQVKRDFIADTRKVRMVVEAVKGEALPVLALDDREHFRINELVHDQIGGHYKIPAAYYDKMRRGAPRLLADNVNHWFEAEASNRMIRTLDARARAFLSDRFRALDNFDLMEAALPRLSRMGVEILSCDVTETNLYLKVVDKRMMRDLPAGWTKENRGHSRFDTVAPALVLSNSEVGAGAIQCRTSIYFGGCTNLTVIKEGSVKKAHLGAKHDLGDEVYAMLSDTTKRLSDIALWAQIGDYVEAAFSEAKFEANLERLRRAQEEVINPKADVARVIEVTAKKFGLNDGERGSVLQHLIKGGDLSLYGLHNAVTRTAQDLASYDRASEFERLGGVILELPKNDWAEINRLATKALAEDDEAKAA